MAEQTHQSYFRNGMVKQFLNILQQSASKLLRSFFIQSSIIVVCVFILSFISAMYIYMAPYNFVEKEITISKGEKTWNILSSLYHDSVLPHPIVALFGAILTNGSIKIVAGDYLFKIASSPKEILKMLRKGQTIEHRIIFPEGWSTHEIITRINNDNRLSGVIPNNIKEGTLFPSTYYIHRHQDRSQLIQKMTDTMNQVLDELMTSNHNPFIRTSKDLIVFASILERETAAPEELPKIAGVFINRLKKGMRLQSDPTVIYGMTLGKSSLNRPLTRQDLKVDSDYNTYTRHGLPKEPICCPGLAALEAAAHPAETDELYFVLEENGKKHRFSTTYRDHLKHIRRIQNLLRIANE